MLLILHGENQVVSRKALSSYIEAAKLKNVEVISLNGAKATENSVLEAVESNSFFSSTKLVVIENLFKHLSKKTLKAIISYLSSLATTDNVIIWQKNTLTPSQLKSLKQFESRVFKTSPATFQFLDSLHPGKHSRWLDNFAKACKQDTPEFVFAMLSRQVRLLLQVPEPDAKIPPWQLQKLKKQFSKFSQDQLLNLHAALGDIDYRLKSGLSHTDLLGELQFALAKL